MQRDVIEFNATRPNARKSVSLRLEAAPAGQDGRSGPLTCAAGRAITFGA